jgi:molybdate transport system substrate-binding protein
VRIVPVALVALILAGCSTSAPDAGLTVYAAASLKQPFTRIGQLYEEQHPGAQVTFNFAGSSDLVAQLDHGAPADVLATADETTMTDAVGSGTATGPRIFATNTLQIVVPAGNPGGVGGFSDLTDPSLRVVVCAPQVPCGAATVRVEENSGVEIAPASEESSVTDVLGKVTSGQADAGVVYRSDVISAGPAVQGLRIPARDNTVNRYPIAVASDRPDAAGFVELVLSDQGQQILRDHGFGPP